MKVTIGQINTTNGDIEGNIVKIANAIEKAKLDGADLIAFPEVATHGYTSQDWFQDHDIIRDCELPLSKIVPLTKGITAIVGTIRRNPGNDGRRLFSSAAVISDGEIIGFADKTLLPEYDIFDDPRYFEPAESRKLFTINGKKIGIAVCEDIWNDRTFWDTQLYKDDPTEELIEKGAEMIVAVNASPFTRGKIDLRCEMVAHRARSNRVPIVFVNLVGANDGVIFDGSSLCADEEGDIILQAPAFEEFIESVEIDVRKPDSRGITGNEIETLRRALVFGIRDYAKKNGFEKAVLGLSGGIDSALVATLACEALSPENVLCVMMPSPFSSEGSILDSKELVKNLGCEYRVESISEPFNVLLNQLKFDAPKIGGENLAAENLQSRLRGVIVMTISNAEQRLVLATGNKSELAVGYCTLYGDTNGGIAVIGDVLKTEAYALSQWINDSSGREIIPKNIIDKEPSAELAPNQFDSDSLPPYSKMDPVLKLYLEEKLSPLEIIDQGFDEELVFMLLNRVESSANEFKRRQLPTTLIVSRNAIGMGRRRPITQAYKRIRIS